MNFQTKTLYNLLRYNYLEGNTIKCEPWQIEDLREVELNRLFKNLEQFNVILDKKHFLAYAEKYDTPEEFSSYLIALDNEKIKDRTYLIVFEIWRRLLPEKRSLSIFLDELDFRIYLYDKGKLDTDELIQDAIANLLDILDENVDLGQEPEAVFQSISKYCVHDLEGFLYDYIADQIDNEHDTYAMDLLEGFYPFFSNLKWFDFLRIRIYAKTDISLVNDILKNILKDLKDKPDLELQLEILDFLSQTGDPDLFVQLARETALQVTSKGHFLELLEVTSDFYLFLDKESKSLAVKKIINKFKFSKKPKEELQSFLSIL